MATTTKKDLIDRITAETGEKRLAVRRIVQAFLNSVIDELRAGNRLEFRDFGVFEPRERAPRIAQNPKTLEQVPVPARRTIKFKAGRLMKLAMDSDADDDVVFRLTDDESQDEHAVGAKHPDRATPAPHRKRRG
ncbi:MAG: HU family DNA-binding protein [Phycisphaeraceae bacterium]|nr:HU family DNA-binding protein [Phycisphaeraceae bacterium]